MFEKDSFVKQIVFEIDAAIIGINSDDWFCYRPGMKQTEVIDVMKKRRFDVVPITDKTGRFRKYYTLDLKNDRLIVNDIESEEKIYYLTHIRDVIRLMHKSKRSHYFLSNFDDVDDIVGLISLSNMNSRIFYVYLYSLVSFVEREFASIIEVDESKAFEIIRGFSTEVGASMQLQTVVERIKKDRIENIENDYKEYLYIHHLIWLLIGENSFQKLGYKNGSEFQSGTGILKELRNMIAHPVKSLVRNHTDLTRLKSGMDKLYEFKERLEKCTKSNSLSI